MLSTVVLWTVTVGEALALGAAGLGKFVNPDFWVIMFMSWGYPPWVSTAVGSLEVTGALLLLVPPVAPWAAAVLFVDMAVAFVTLLVNRASLPLFAPAVHMALLSVIIVIRLYRRPIKSLA